MVTSHSKDSLLPLWSNSVHLCRVCKCRLEGQWLRVQVKKTTHLPAGVKYHVCQTWYYVFNQAHSKDLRTWQGFCDFLKPACVILLCVSEWGKVHFCDLIFLPQVEDDEERSAVPASESSCRGEDISVNLQPTNAYEFGQALNAARCSGNTAACADLLASTTPEMLPQLLSTQLDGHNVGFMMQALDSHLVEKNPDLVYQHLNHLHTAERFSVRCNVPLLYSLFCNTNI